MGEQSNEDKKRESKDRRDLSPKARSGESRQQMVKSVLDDTDKMIQRLEQERAQRESGHKRQKRDVSEGGEIHKDDFEHGKQHIERKILEDKTKRETKHDYYAARHASKQEKQQKGLLSREHDTTRLHDKISRRDLSPGRAEFKRNPGNEEQHKERKTHENRETRRSDDKHREQRG